MYSATNNFGRMKTNCPLNITNLRGASATKTTKDIRLDKKINQNNSLTKSLRTIKSSYEKKKLVTGVNQQIELVRDHSLMRNNSVQLQKFKSSVSLVLILQQKVKTLVNSLFLELQIYRKIQSAIRRKKTIISKLFGWDEVFADIFFEGEQIRPKICEQNLKNSILGCINARNVNQVRSLFNKMRFFHAQLQQYNIKQQSLQINIKSRYLQKSLSQFRRKINKLLKPEGKQSSITFQLKKFSPVKVKRSLRHALQLNNIYENGSLGLNDLDLRWQQGIDKLQSIVKRGFQTCFDKQ